MLRNLLTQEEKKGFTDALTEIERWPTSDDKWFTYYETLANGGKRLSRLENFYLYHDFMRTLVLGKLGQAAADLIGERAVVLKDKINFKYPGGTGYDAHQDGPGYEMFDQFFHMSALIPSDPMTLENGCLKLVAGDWGRLPWLPLDKNGDIQEEIAREFKWDPVICDAGTVVMFNSHVPHKSDVNETKEKRRAAYITWNGISLGDIHKDFYDKRRVLYPSDHLRDPNKDYSEGVQYYKEHILEMANGKMPKAERGNY